MIVLAVWHEISIRYILWGLLHAIAINVWYRYEATRWYKKLSVYPVCQHVIGTVVTLNFVMLSFVLISGHSLIDSVKVLRTLLF